MARIALGGLTTFNLATHLDPMTLELYEVRDLFTVSGSNLGLGITPAGKFHVHGSVRQQNVVDGSDTVSCYDAAGALRGNLFCTASLFAIESNGVPLRFYVSGTEVAQFNTSRHLLAGVDNTQTLGGASNRWSTVYAGTGTINTSDAREKTAVASLTPAEIAAARDICREVGGFKFLAAVAAKGDAARTHIGLTVQRVMEIMRSHGLEPTAYAFICHDTWAEQVVEHPATTRPHPTMLANDGQPMQVPDQPARREVIPGGDRYGFRADELLLFIARGIEARITALEEAA